MIALWQVEHSQWPSEVDFLNVWVTEYTFFIIIHYIKYFYLAAMLNIKHVTHKLCVDTQQQQKTIRKQNYKIVITLDQRRNGMSCSFVVWAEVRWCRVLYPSTHSLSTTHLIQSSSGTEAYQSCHKANDGVWTRRQSGAGLKERFRITH